MPSSVDVRNDPPKRHAVARGFDRIAQAGTNLPLLRAVGAQGVAQVRCDQHAEQPTWLDTGLPGNPNSGVSFHSPKSGGDPGRIFILQKCTSPSSSMMRRT